MIRFVIAVLLSTAVSAHAADLSGSYICSYTAIGGIIYDKSTEQWKPASSQSSFPPEVVRIKMVSPENEQDRAKYAITLKMLGSDKQESPCVHPDTAESAISEFSSYLRCFNGTEYLFHLGSLRFQRYARGGYMYQPMGFDNAFVALGTCEKVS